MSENNECSKCLTRLKVWSLIVSLFLSLIKAVIGILGSCESLVADGLYSLYQSYIIAKSILVDAQANPAGNLKNHTSGNVSEKKNSNSVKNNLRKKPNKFAINKFDMIKGLYLAGMIISTILILGIIDVTAFSVVRMIKASKGLLVNPSPYALYAAVLSILANQVFYKYSLCLNKNPVERPCKKNQPVPKSMIELNQSYKLSIIISTIVLISVSLARICWIYADALAAIVVGIILAICTVGLLKLSSKTVIDMTLSGKT